MQLNNNAGVTRVARATTFCLLGTLFAGCTEKTPDAASTAVTAGTQAAPQATDTEARDPLRVILPAGEKAPLSPEKYQALARAILAELVGIDTTQSKGSTTRAAEAAKARLLAAGFAPADVAVIVDDAVPRKGNLLARIPGSDPALKPVLLLAHIDVVEADPKDWTLPPFELIEKDGAFYGRGVADNKDEAAIYLANLIRMKDEGFVPTRGIVLALTADEEGGDNNGVELLLDKHRGWVDAAFVFNEGGGGQLAEDGRRISNAVQAAEKVFQNFTFEVTNPGGHSSRPREDNAIRQLGAALSNVSPTVVPVKLNEVSREYLQRTAEIVGGDDGAAMKALVANESDAAAIARLSRNPVYNAVIRTACVPTLIEGGHASNALPQRATATVNCRMVPGDTTEFVQEALARAVAAPEVKITPANPAKPSDPSPLGGDVLAAISKVTEEMWPGVPVVPTMSTGATDSLYFRGAGIPAYGVSGLFYAETGAHGMNERIPVQSFHEGQEFLYRLVKEVASR